MKITETRNNKRDEGSDDSEEKENKIIRPIRVIRGLFLEDTMNKHGYTVIETIISLAILLIILGIVLASFIAGLRHWIGGEPIVDIQNIARETVTGKGNWRGIESELRELHAILNAEPENTQFQLRKDKIRFVGMVAIINGSDNICSTFSLGDDLQIVGTGTISLPKYKGITLITVGTNGTLQSIPGDINGDGTLTSTERDNSDDYACGGFMCGGKDAVIIAGTTPYGTICHTHKRGDDIQVVPVGQTTGIHALLISPGNNGILESVPGDLDGDGDTDVQHPNNFISSAIISYEFLPGTNTLIRKINDEKPNSSRHFGPSIIAKNVATFTITYYGTNGVTTIPYGTVPLDQVNSIGLIEIQGTVTTLKKGGVGKGTDTSTFKTRIQPRALNPAYRRL